jgi:hypothetical protein
MIPLDELKVDVARLDFTPTGIFVRAKDPSGKLCAFVCHNCHQTATGPKLP